MGKKKNDNIVLSYFNSIGLNAIKNPDTFWGNIKLFHGKEVHDQLIDILEARADIIEEDSSYKTVENIYEVKNQNLKLSIDFSSLTADFTRRFLEWLIQYKQNINPKKILEIGCDNGITSCFLALQFPDSEVIGIDISENGINCAKELADKLGIKNVSFVSSDFETFSKESKDNFEMIVSLRTVHELIGYPLQSQHFSTTELIEKLDLEENPAIKAIKDLLRDDNSIYVSCERLPKVESYAYWSELLKKSQLYINWNVAGYNCSFQFNDLEKMPIFVATGTNNNISTFDGLVNFESNENNYDMNSFTNVTGIVAEDYFIKIMDKELVRGEQVNWKNGSGNFRLECWKDDNYAYLYKYNNVGHRELLKYPLEEINEAFEEIDMFLAMYASPAHTVTYSYKTIEERDEQNKLAIK